jgi:hypothetical protein
MQDEHATTSASRIARACSSGMQTRSLPGCQRVAIVASLKSQQFEIMEGRAIGE